METLEQLQKILDDAPEDATHKTKHCFLWLTNPNVWRWHYCGEWQFLNGDTDISEFEDYRSLADIQNIVDLMKLNQEMHQQVSGYLHGEGLEHWQAFNQKRFKI